MPEFYPLYVGWATKFVVRKGDSDWSPQALY
jgi:hypothetical protein